MGLLPRGYKVREIVQERRVSDEARDQLNALQRQYRRERQKRESAWNDGFRAAVTMLENGATLERLKAALGEGPLTIEEISDGVPMFARGTRDFEKGDTEPVDMDTFVLDVADID